jgi:hypothetical protein
VDFWTVSPATGVSFIFSEDSVLFSLIGGVPVSDSVFDSGSGLDSEI